MNYADKLCDQFLEERGDLIVLICEGAGMGTFFLRAIGWRDGKRIPVLLPSDCRFLQSQPLRIWHLRRDAVSAKDYEDIKVNCVGVNVGIRRRGRGARPTARLSSMLTWTRSLGRAREPFGREVWPLHPHTLCDESKIDCAGY